ncbi:MAG: anaerobic ribonucleoside-triphosphate reductase [Candidatus Bathyarchaeia archaeon]
MPRKPQKISADIFNAASAPTRLQVLKLLNMRGPLAYSEIMEMLNLEPAKDAGKFVYHLRSLLSADLIDVDTATKKYKITELGTIVVNFSQSLEEYSLKKSGKLLVRTSRHTIEGFERSKITKALVEEAELPQDLAEKISLEAEERLLKVPAKYLTAPLIREFVNAILIEKGLEDYRHKLTRLGMPVYDVTVLFREAAKESRTVEDVYSAAGGQVMTEYMLLKILPKEIADAHLSGQIYICQPSSWVLKPRGIYHDLRYFLSKDLGALETSLLLPYCPKPKSLAGALVAVSYITETFKREVAGEQTIDYFNIFLAPYLEGLSDGEALESLKGLLCTIGLRTSNQPGVVTLGLEALVPEHLKESPAIVPPGGREGVYGEYEDEAERLMRLLFEAALELSEKKPLLNPRLLLKFRRECLADEYDESLLKAHELAARFGVVYIANNTEEWQNTSSYDAVGGRIEADATGDWEVDTMRTGCLANITVNLPRIAYEARGSDERFFGDLDSAFQIVDRALDIKYQVMEDRLKSGLLPYLQYSTKEAYYRLERSLKVISVIGLDETVKFHVDRHIYEDVIAQNFAVQIMEHLASLASLSYKKSGRRFTVSQISEERASRALAEQDLEKYGRSTVYRYENDRPLYTNYLAVPREAQLSPLERLQFEARFHPLSRGGHLAPVPLEDGSTSEELLKQTKEICANYSIGLFVYSPNLSHCSACGRTFRSHLTKCSACGSTNITRYSRTASGYLPLSSP